MLALLFELVFLMLNEGILGLESERGEHFANF